MAELWTLSVELEPRSRQGNVDPELEWPNDDATRLIAFAQECWGLFEDDFDDAIRWSDDGTQVTLVTDVLDSLQEILPWIVMHTLLVRMTLTCSEDIRATRDSL